MLIECPECNKMISDRASVCPNCGCPIDKMDFANYCNVNGKSHDFSDIVELLPQVGSKDTDVSPIYITGMISRKTQLDWDCAKELADILIKTKTVPKRFDGSLKVRNERIQASIPKCPTCQSTNIQKISPTERVGSIAMWGIFSKKINKSFKCKNCGYTW